MMNPLKPDRLPPGEHPALNAIRTGSRGMAFLHYTDPRFLEGLRQHGVPGCHGYRVLSIGLSGKPFNACFPTIGQINGTRQPFHVDRILGGAPYVDLDGIEEVARNLRDNPAFLGFQAHEWGHSSILDNRRIQERFTASNLPFNSGQFQKYRNRSKRPYFSSGDYEVYKDLPRELKTPDDLLAFFRGFFSYFSERTEGLIMAVNGYYQLYHFAAGIGVRSLAAEVGNQVPLTCMQIAAVRGAARQTGKPFGVYYEPWGGKPASCTSALPWSPWFGEEVPLEDADQGLGLAMGRDLGSSRSLQRRLLFYSWLSGAAFISEEWGAENYFRNWRDFELADYGRIALEFEKLASRHPRPEPIVPIALVMPPGTPGIDVLYLTEEDENTPLFKCLPADSFHRLLRVFVHQFLAARPHVRGLDDSNLTPSPFNGSFDVLGHDASPSLLDRYELVIYFDPAQKERSALPSDKTMCYEGNPAQAAICRETVRKSWPVQVDGEVGCTVSRLGERFVVGVFNNLGIVKEGPVETGLPEATRMAGLKGEFHEVNILAGSAFVHSSSVEKMEILIPAGEIFLMSFRAAGDRARRQPAI